MWFWNTKLNHIYISQIPLQHTLFIKIHHFSKSRLILCAVNNEYFNVCNIHCTKSITNRKNPRFWTLKFVYEKYQRQVDVRKIFSQLFLETNLNFCPAKNFFWSISHIRKKWDTYTLAQISNWRKTLWCVIEEGIC